jgi:hypothetical protein
MPLSLSFLKKQLHISENSKYLVWHVDIHCTCPFLLIAIAFHFRVPKLLGWVQKLKVFQQLPNYSTRQMISLGIAEPPLPSQ